MGKAAESVVDYERAQWIVPTDAKLPQKLLAAKVCRIAHTPSSVLPKFTDHAFACAVPSGPRFTRLLHVAVEPTCQMSCMSTLRRTGQAC